MGKIMTSLDAEIVDQITGRSIPVTVRSVNGTIEVYFDGYGTVDQEDGPPVFVECWDNALRLVVNRDINTEDQDIITLEGAKESRRE